jgi:chemotaxis protein histidine kinase CheA
MSFFKTLEEYFKKNWKSIAIVVMALFLITAIIAIRGIEFKRNPNKQLEKIILYEKFSGREGLTNGEEAVLEDGFCKRPSDVLEQSCGNLQEKSCKNSDCCIWGRPNTEMDDSGEGPITNPEGCYYGDENGAKINNTRLNLDWWYYKGKDRNSAERFPKGKLPEIGPEGKEGLKTKDPEEEKEKQEIRDKLANEFLEKPVTPPGNKIPLEDVAAAAATEKKLEKATEDQGRAEEAKDMQDMDRELDQKQELDRLVFKHAQANEKSSSMARWARHEHENNLAEVVRTGEEKEAAKSKAQKSENELHKAQRDHGVKAALAGNDAGPADAAALAVAKADLPAKSKKSIESRIDYENKKREEDRAAKTLRTQGVDIHEKQLPPEASAAEVAKSVSNGGFVAQRRKELEAKLSAAGGLGGLAGKFGGGVPTSMAAAKNLAKQKAMAMAKKKLKASSIGKYAKMFGF